MKQSKYVLTEPKREVIMRHEEKEQALIQNLKDAGCDCKIIEAFVEDFRQNKIAEGLKLLAIQRRSLLENLHKKQKQIDCLDYLVYQLEKVQKTKA